MLARIVHGNKVNAELLPWHFSANMLNTIFRFAAEFNAFDPTLSAFDVWRHDPHDFDANATHTLDFSLPMLFGLETVLHV